MSTTKDALHEALKVIGWSMRATSPRDPETGKSMHHRIVNHLGETTAWEVTNERIELRPFADGRQVWGKKASDAGNSGIASFRLSEVRIDIDVDLGVVSLLLGRESWIGFYNFDDKADRAAVDRIAESCIERT